MLERVIETLEGCIRALKDHNDPTMPPHVQEHMQVNALYEARATLGQLCHMKVEPGEAWALAAQRIEIDELKQKLAATTGVIAGLQGRIEDQRTEIDALRQTLELIGVDGSQDPQMDAEDILVELGIWTRERPADWTPSSQDESALTATLRSFTEGIAASEDCELIRKSFRRLGLPDDLVETLMRRVVGRALSNAEIHEIWLALPESDDTAIRAFARKLLATGVYTTAVPEGFKLAPLKATPAMAKAGGHVNSEWYNDMAPINESHWAHAAPGIWEAMLAAAPEVTP
jgi:hypothetical protein